MIFPMVLTNAFNVFTRVLYFLKTETYVTV